MNPPASISVSLAAFEQSIGAEVRVSELAGTGETLVQMTATPAAVGDAVLAILYDLSDSSDATARLVGRIRGLLTGWPRDIRLWAYALGDDKPLPAVAAGTVGHLLDGALDLLAPFNDTRLIERHRCRGSFLEPTVAALAERSAAECVGVVHAVLIGDGQLTDFAPITIPPSIDLLAMVDDEIAAGRARARWREVAADAPLLSFNDHALEHWFVSRRSRTTSHRWVRVTTVPQSGVSRLDARLPARALPSDWFEWDLRQGSLRLVVNSEARQRLRVQYRGVNGMVEMDWTTLSGARPVSEADRALIGIGRQSATAASLPLAFDTATAGPSAGESAWQAAASAFGLAETNQPWTAEIVAALVPGTANVSAVLCLMNREPIGPKLASDRVIVLAINADRPVLAWRTGDALPIGRAAEAWTIGYDAYEDRWSLSVQNSASDESVSAPTRIEMHPTGSQRLPPCPVLSGPTWTAVFSGPLSVAQRQCRARG